MVAQNNQNILRNRVRQCFERITRNPNKNVASRDCVHFDSLLVSMKSCTIAPKHWRKTGAPQSERSDRLLVHFVDSCLGVDRSGETELEPCLLNRFKISLPRARPA